MFGEDDGYAVGMFDSEEAHMLFFCLFVILMFLLFRTEFLF